MTEEIKHEQIILEGKIFALLGYWFFLCIIPLVLKKDNKFACFHAKQGLVLFIFVTAGFIFAILPILGYLIFKAVLFVYLVMSLWGIINALRGRYFRLPIVASIADKIII